MVRCIRSVIFVSAVACGLVFGNTIRDDSVKEDLRKWDQSNEYEGKVTVAARVVKNVFEPNEPVPIMIGIANHSAEPVYLLTDTPDVLGKGSATVTDANGIYFSPRTPLDYPPGPPPSYFIVKDGKRIFVEPVSKINAPGLLLTLFPDVLSGHHGHLPEGTYDLDLGCIPIVHEISDIIVREDVSHRLWIGPGAKTVFSLYKLDPIRIEIRKQEPKSL